VPRIAFCSLLAAALLAPDPCTALAGPERSVDQTRLMDTLRALPPNRSAWGSDDNRRALAQTETLLIEHLRDMGFTVAEHPFEAPIPRKRWRTGAAATDGPEPADQPETLRTRNLSIDITGTELPLEVLLVGAHFDCVENCPGADDNGTGTAAALELARVLKDSLPRRTIRIAFFSMEEQGLVGAKHYLAGWNAANRASVEAGTPTERIIGMMSLEMLGFFSDEPESQKTPAGLDKLAPGITLPTVGNFIAITGLQKHQRFSAPLAAAMLKTAPELSVFRADFFPFAIPDLYRSDHAPFMMADIPAVMITDTSNYRNPHYHMPTDSIETIDAVRFTRVVRAVAGAVSALAEAGVPAAEEPKER